MRRIWAVLLVVLGVNLWALMALGPLELEFADTETRLWALAVYLSPLLLLGAGLISRHAVVALFFFPASLIPIYLTIPEADRSVHETAAGFVSLALSAVLYAGVASAWLAQHEHRLAPWLERVLGRDQGVRARTRSAEELSLRSVAPPPLRRDLWWPYRWFFAPRVFFLAALFVVPAWGLNFHDGVAEAYATGFGRAASDARVLANLMWIFLWIVVAYLFFFSPGLNLELEQRQMDASLRTFAQRTLRRKSWVYALGSAVLAGGLLLVLAAWRLV